MIKIENIEVFNFEGAFRGMRNPMNSWEKRDSYFGISDYEDDNDYIDTFNIAYEIAKQYCVPGREEDFGVGSDIFPQKISDIKFTKDVFKELVENFFKFLSEDDIPNDFSKEKYKEKMIEVYFKTLDLFLLKYLPSDNCCGHFVCIGPNDLALAQKLINCGPVHSKFMRQIFVSMDINAPLYWWKEMDTYKVGTAANSCSTMHKIHSKEFALDDFSYEHLLHSIDIPQKYRLSSLSPASLLNEVLLILNKYREIYLETKDKRYWWQMIQLLPSSYNQKRTWTADYETLRNIYKWRKNHKLDEWQDFCKMIESLPYAKELICYEGEIENE